MIKVVEIGKYPGNERFSYISLFMNTIMVLRNMDFLTNGFSHGHRLFYLEELSSKYESLTQKLKQRQSLVSSLKGSQGENTSRFYERA